MKTPRRAAIWPAGALAFAAAFSFTASLLRAIASREVKKLFAHDK